MSLHQPGYALLTLQIKLADEGISFGLVDHQFLTDLSEVVTDFVLLAPQCEPRLAVFAVDRLAKELHLHE